MTPAPRFIRRYGRLLFLLVPLPILIFHLKYLEITYKDIPRLNLDALRRPAIPWKYYDDNSKGSESDNVPDSAPIVPEACRCKGNGTEGVGIVENMCYTANGTVGTRFDCQFVKHLQVGGKGFGFYWLILD